jgi:hypothetical protein
MKASQGLSLLTPLLALLLVEVAGAYPLDDEATSGIRRLQGYLLEQQSQKGAKLWPGQLWYADDIRLRLVDYKGPDFDLLPEDPDLAGFLTENFRRRDRSYSMVILDMTDPQQLRWAGLRPDLKQNAGSVGKLICMAAVFHALAEAFPDTSDRARILREAESTAGRWVSNEIHKVPKWNEAEQRNLHSVINQRDRFRLSEWIDHAISASANGAGSIIWREAMLIRHFGADYPVSDADSEQFFRETPKATLAELARAVVTEPLQQAGIDTANLQQGSFWTTNSKNIVPGRISFATPRELARFALRIEQGLMVDAWSSLQMKKYMYLTKRRYRYSYAPELGESAVFFKSGSLYSCQPEEGFRCDKYMGNVRNMMNSVAIVEGSELAEPHYLVTLMSNVLKINSAWDHSRIAAAVHETIRTNVSQSLRENASAREMEDAGKSE